jgi:hypothetical protein
LSAGDERSKGARRGGEATGAAWLLIKIVLAAVKRVETLGRFPARTTRTVRRP